MKTSVRIASAAIAFLWTSLAALAAPLAASDLYTKTAKGCRALDLPTWSHPTRKVMERAGVKILKVELCNGGVYPIFTVAFAATPILAVNDKYFGKLYAQMAEANGWHSLAFVDPAWELIVSVDVTGRRRISIGYEEFEAAPTAK
jgi:hypothetical protein